MLRVWLVRRPAGAVMAMVRPALSQSMWVVAPSGLVMVLAFIASHQPDELAEARMSKVITFIDVVASLAFIPIVLIGQGVLTYYWAVS